MPLRQPIAPSTLFPNRLIDEVMPTLKDTEWRVLCVIVRQTIGWQSAQKGQRKSRDWLTQSQLQTRTGRATEALSRAIDALVRRRLVEVWNDQGELLLTPQARRRYRGRLFFSLSTSALNDLWSTDQRASQSEQPSSKSEFRKANTTKETETKLLPYGSERQRSHSFTSPEKLPLKQRLDEPAHIQQPHREPPNPDVKRFLSVYRTMFQQHTTHGEPPIIDWGKDGKLVKHLLKIYSYDRLVSLLQQFFDSPDEWIRKTGYSLAAFRAVIGSLLVREHHDTRSVHQVMRTGRWSQAADGLPERFKQ